MIAIKTLLDNGYKQFETEHGRIRDKTLYQKRIRNEAGATEYFINAWVYDNMDKSQNIEFELCTETTNSFWSRYLIYSIPNFTTLEDIEKSISLHYLIDGALYGD